MTPTKRHSAETLEKLSQTYLKIRLPSPWKYNVKFLIHF
jgi:hypothetical protein